MKRVLFSHHADTHREPAKRARSWRARAARKAAGVIFCAALTAGLAVPAYAAGWQHNGTGWWYGTNADNTQWYSSSWQWIDGNGDDIAECYAFDGNGYMYAGQTTPDGYAVNADGAWTVGGVVQTKAVRSVSGAVDESLAQRVGAALAYMEQKYPEGTPWTNDTAYRGKGLFDGAWCDGYGCAAFAMMMTDMVYGSAPARRSYDISEIAVGDEVRLNNDTHSVVVIGMDDSGVTFAEGNYNYATHYGRRISMDELRESFTYVVKRPAR